MAQLSKEHYTADACVVWCFDNRFWPAFTEFITEKGFTNFDPVLVAGGAKGIGDPSSDAEREQLLRQIELSKKLHHTKRVILMTHEDCGAFGGSVAFADSTAERARHAEVVALAREAIQKRFPDMDIEAVFSGFHETTIV